MPIAQFLVNKKAKRSLRRHKGAEISKPEYFSVFAVKTKKENL
jgi:hypothetical protein